MNGALQHRSIMMASWQKTFQLGLRAIALAAFAMAEVLRQLVVAFAAFIASYPLLSIAIYVLISFFTVFQDNNGHTFATRLGYIFVIGKGSKSYVSLPKGNGVRMTVAEERDKRLAAKV